MANELVLGLRLRNFVWFSFIVNRGDMRYGKTI